MNASLLVFLGLLAVFCLALLYFFHEVLKELPAIIAEHARVYARAYAKATCLILITAGAAFKETFGGLTAQAAAAMTWWDWAIMFWAPITAALGVIIAFLDTSVAAAQEKKISDTNGGTQSPFTKKPATTPTTQPNP